MKPVLVLCMAFLCLSMVFAAPAPAPIVPLVVSSSGALVLPTLVSATGTALTASELAAVAGAGLLGKAALIAALSQ